MDKLVNDYFELEKFKAIGKENDYVFQALSFLGESSQKLSIARTILTNNDEAINDEVLLKRLMDVQQEVHYIKDCLRKG